MNTGGVANIMAGICDDRVVLWEEVGKRWCGARAAEMYRGPVIKCLRKRRPSKRSYLLVEDNDPTGWKCMGGAGVLDPLLCRDICHSFFVFGRVWREFG